MDTYHWLLYWNYTGSLRPKGKKFLAVKLTQGKEVKVLRVLPSGRIVPHIQGLFYLWRVWTSDIGEVVTPFIQDGTYPTRNFATLGPLTLQPPYRIFIYQAIKGKIQEVAAVNGQCIVFSSWISSSIGEGIKLKIQNYRCHEWLFTLYHWIFIYSCPFISNILYGPVLYSVYPWMFSIQHLLILYGYISFIQGKNTDTGEAGL
jgi:hypothetical protein